MSDSGHIWLDDETIRYGSSTFGDWALPLSDVRVIGECTNQSWGDDYFFCFATGPEMWNEASFYAEGRDQFLRELGTKLRLAEVGLCGSTDFASRVLWPPELAGEPMFKYTDLPAKGLLRRLFGLPRNLQTYSDRVAAMLAGNH